MTIDALNKLDVFTTLTPDEVSRIYNKMEHHDVLEGEVLFHEGDPGSLMYIVRSGKVAITVSVSDGEDVEVSQIGEGSFFGEMSIFEKDVRSATCRAIGRCSLLSLDETAFHAIMEEDPKTAIKVMQQMLKTATTRLQNTDGFLSDLVKWGEKSRIRAVTDDFTGLYNRRFFDESLEKAVSVSTKNNTPLSLVMMDIDRFGTLNKLYGEAVGDEVLQAIIPIFRGVFDEYDILVRYGGDEFAFILPGKDGKTALERCWKVEELLKEIDILEKLNGSFKIISGSIGIAQCPLHAQTARDLLDKADRALYEAKEAGRGQVSLFGESKLRMKRRIPNNWVKNALLDSFIDTICSRSNFLVTGHKNPDPDCIASCVAFSLILAKFSKKASVIINEEHKNDFIDLVNLCQFSNIQLIETPEDLEDHYDTIVVLDTPKPSMLEFRDEVQSLTKKEGTVSMEIDHHIDADGTYIGDRDYCLVDAVSSTCELIAHLSLRLSKKWRLLKQMSIGKLFTQDLLMAVVTGIMSDTHMGKSINNRMEKRHYITFEKLLNQSLINPSESIDKSRISSTQDIADQLGLRTEDAKKCYDIFSQNIQSRNNISYITLNESISDDLFEQFDKKTVTEVAKYASNLLAEENGSFSLVAFYDSKAESDFIQLRMRRNLDFSGLDLRRILERFKIENGGGHEGAIGFRVPRSQITDLEAFVEMIIFGAMDSICQ